ncbi:MULTISPECIES: APC family permease [Phyllobacteriaceae]|jgi:amino acid transporter|uniref:APC family permease n=1 Tax=Phyllobacteriaceae TaxID=69277 RepID=UPI000466A17D|nr:MULTISPECIES: APC family permease [Mesorhizobium]MBN9237869.1 APC family permease [Mesorhizobium sp.]MDQ0328287.1 amino acid transporter [Mesorhizobium sp. YL-MeA3-2017]
MPSEVPNSSGGLDRALNALGTLMIVLSAVTPASSVFIIVPGVIALAGTGSFLSFVLAGVIGLFMAFVYAELSSAYPTAGGEYTMIGRTLGRFWGFVTLVLVFVSIVLIIAVVALGVGTYLGVLMPNLNAQWVGVATIILAGVVAALRIKLNAFVTGIFLGIEMLALVILTVLGFIHVERPLSSLFTAPQILDTTNALVPASAGLIMAATAVAIFAYNGYGAAAYFGEETQDAKRSIGKVVVWALLITVAAELIPLTAVLLGSPDLVGLLAAPQKIEYFLEARGGHTLTVLVSLAIAVAIFNAVIAIVLQAARLLFSSGRDKTWFGPINNAVASVHGTYASPWIATIVVAVLAAAACFIDINLLLVVSGTSLVVIYALLCLGAIAGRRNGATANGHYRMPFFPVPAVLAFLALVYVAYQNLLDASFGRPSLMATLAIMAVAAVYYVLFLARRADWTMHAPEEIAG